MAIISNAERAAGTPERRPPAKPVESQRKSENKGWIFFADCQACGSSRPYFTNPAEDKAEAAE
jgi:hypothetical protein